MSARALFTVYLHGLDASEIEFRVIDAFGSGGRLLRIRPETPNLIADEREDQ